MRLYLTPLSLEELESYPAAVRPLLVQRARCLLRQKSWFTSWLPHIFSSGGCVLGVAVSGYLNGLTFADGNLRQRIGSTIVWYMVAFIVGGLAGGLVGLQLELSKLRQHLPQAMQEYVHAIRSRKL